MNECRVWEVLVPLLLQVATVKRNGGDHCRQAGRQAVPNPTGRHKSE
jgi:hypothetical protein